MKPICLTRHVTRCDCCGQEDLPSTILFSLHDGHIAHYSNRCATKMTGRTEKDIFEQIFEQLNMARAKMRKIIQCTAEAKEVKRLIQQSLSDRSGLTVELNEKLRSLRQFVSMAETYAHQNFGMNELSHVIGPEKLPAVQNVERYLVALHISQH